MRAGLELWASELGVLSSTCERARAEDAQDVVKTAYSLIASAPAPANELFLSLPSAERIRNLLRCEAVDQAALDIVRERAGYLLSRSLEGFCLATVVLSGGNDEQSLLAQTPALALMGSFSRALQERFAVGSDFQVVTAK